MDHAALEAAIAADPDDRTGYAIYGDWLTQDDDPRGEWIAVQLAREERPDDPDLRAREEMLLATHEAQWLGGLTSSGFWPTRPIKVRWRRGFVEAVEIETQYESPEAALIYRELAKLPVARFVRDLRIGVACSYHDAPVDDVTILDALRDHPLPAVRSIVFDTMDFQRSWTHLGDLARAHLGALPHLETLEITAGRITLGAIEIPQLRRLRLETGGLRAHVLHSIAAARWPALEELVLYLGTENYGGTCTLADTQPILDGTNLPKVTTLALCNTTFGDEIAERIVTAAILPRLRRLDLSQSTLGDAGAQVLLDHASALAHLEFLDLRECYLTGALAAELAERFPYADVSVQRIDQGYGRFVAVSE